MTERFDVFISSTSRDLPEFREALMGLIVGWGMFPIAMEHFDAKSDNALQVCYDAVCESELFVGVYAHRYGYAPRDSVTYTKKDGSKHSGDGVTGITEWEYRWALEREIPLILFVIDSDAVWKVSDIEGGPAAERLKAFKAEIGGKHTIKFFSDLEDFKVKMAVELGKAKSQLEQDALNRSALVRPTPEEADERARRAIIAGAEPTKPYREKPRVIGVLPKVFENWEFHDRLTEQNRITNALNARKPLISVYGRGGIGKTALVSKALGDFERGGTYDGLAYFSINQLPPVSAEDVLSTLARFFEPESPLHNTFADASQTMRQKTTALLAEMRDKRYVALLDNLETVQDAKTHTITDDNLRVFIETVLEHHAGNLTLIVTSRLNVLYASLLRPYEETIWLEEGLPPEEAVAFLRDLDPQKMLLPTDDDALRTWAKRVDYMPRSLEALVGYLQGGITRSLDDLLEDEDLFKGEVIANVVHRVLEGLPQAFLMVMQAIAVAGQATTQAMLEYLLAPYLDVTQLRPILERLADGRFISFNRSTRTYGLHRYDREYAFEHQVERGQDDNVAAAPAFTRYALHLRMADYYHQQHLPKGAWRTLEDLQPQLTEFEHRLAIWDYDTAAKLLTDIDFDYLFLWGYADRSRLLHERLQGKIQSRSLAGFSAGNLGNAYWALGQIERAIEYYEQALAISREIKDRRVEGIVLGNLGIAYADLGQIERAIEYYEQALAISREIKDRRVEGAVLGNLGDVYSDLGQIYRAIEYCEQALVISREIKDRHSEGNHLGNLGNALSGLGQIHRAIEYYEQALAISREINDRRVEGAVLGNLGDVYSDLGQIHRAIEYCEQALVISREIKDRRVEGVILGNLGEALGRLGKHDAAILHLRGALEIVTEGKYSSYMSDKALQLARALTHAGYTDEALATIRHAQANDVPDNNHAVACWLGVLALRHATTEEALQAFHKAIRHADNLLLQTSDNYQAVYIRALAHVGLYLLGEKNRLTLAREDYHRARALCSAPGVQDEHRRALAYLLEDTLSLSADDVFGA